MEGQSHRRPWDVARAYGVTRCTYCRHPFNAQRPPTFDHVLPHSERSTSLHASITVLSCQTCNGARGDAPYAAYRAAVDAEWERVGRDGGQYRRPKTIRYANRAYTITTASRAQRTPQAAAEAKPQSAGRTKSEQRHRARAAKSCPCAPCTVRREHEERLLRRSVVAEQHAGIDPHGPYVDEIKVVRSDKRTCP